MGLTSEWTAAERGAYFQGFNDADEQAYAALREVVEGLFKNPQADPFTLNLVLQEL